MLLLSTLFQLFFDNLVRRRLPNSTAAKGKPSHFFTISLPIPSRLDLSLELFAPNACSAIFTIKRCQMEDRKGLHSRVFKLSLFVVFEITDSSRVLMTLKTIKIL
ncbi:uncharacterized protein DS421_13g442140 [Arachis hypogaea]|nr:uncharacterized protein DS421_13g442140 [Arachis hypogaea]